MFLLQQQVGSSKPDIHPTVPALPLQCPTVQYSPTRCSTPALYCLTLVLIAPRVILSGVKLRWLSYLLRFLLLPSVTDSSVSAAPMPEFL